ncbi:MAG: AMP-binding protein [Alphaproteobacteria bacterium]|nr:AMP-binding protein [Alphaproteobacteria bacterium]
MSNQSFYDGLETRDPEVREAELLAALPAQVANAKASALGLAEILADVEPAAIVSRDALAGLPVLRKSELAERQRSAPPLGDMTAVTAGEASRLFTSPGPIYELETARADYWRCARALFAAGFRAGEIAHNSFSYHLTPGGWILDNGLRTLGCAVIPAGIGNTEQQVAAMAQFRPTGWAGTPDYLKTILDKADELGVDVSSVNKAMVTGGALFPSMRAEYAERGVAVLQCYATADVGLIAYETPAQDGMVLDEHLIVEIVRPGTGEPVADGEVGEVVVTTLNPDYPLIRLATGDLSAMMQGQSPCGRTNRRIKGWMGRADQAAKVKGMFVRPEQVEQVRQRHPEILKARLEVGRQGSMDVMTLKCECDSAASELSDAIVASLRDVTKLAGTVEIVAPGGLPNDGKVVDDVRDYQA